MRKLRVIHVFGCSFSPCHCRTKKSQRWEHMIKLCIQASWRKKNWIFKADCLRIVACEDMLIPYRHCLPSYETRTWGNYRYYTDRCVFYHRVYLLTCVVLVYRCLLWEGASCNLSSDGRWCNCSGCSRIGYKAGGRLKPAEAMVTADISRQMVTNAANVISLNLYPPPFFFFNGNLFIDCMLADAAETTSGMQLLHQCNWMVFHERSGEALRLVKTG